MIYRIGVFSATLQSLLLGQGVATDSEPFPSLDFTFAGTLWAVLWAVRYRGQLRQSSLAGLAMPRNGGNGSGTVLPGRHRPFAAAKIPSMESIALERRLASALEHMPVDWLNLTTHRLDIYDETLAKTQFLDEFEAILRDGEVSSSALAGLPTAFDYIRLGHPLSCVLEWAVVMRLGLPASNAISFSSRTAPLLAVLRKNLFAGKSTLLVLQGELPSFFDVEVLRNVYGYRFELQRIALGEDIPSHDGSVVLVGAPADIADFTLAPNVDFSVNVDEALGSIIVVNGEKNADYISEIQHTRRRETIAMTPADCLLALQGFAGVPRAARPRNAGRDEAQVVEVIREVTGTPAAARIGSSGLSVQYAIVMGLVDHALEHSPGKPIRIVVPPNCYGGTNDQARRVAACRDDIEVVDLPVDGGRDMVESLDTVLRQLAAEDAVPLIIAEIPTNPRVEVPNLEKLRDVLTDARTTAAGTKAVEPVFILDQTFCPNVRFLGDGDVLSGVQTIAYVSGSKFPSGGRCTAGYCVANSRAEGYLEKVELHLRVCDNQATDHQLQILAEQLPSMLERIEAAYANTRDFVDYISEALPTAKINFVSDELASQGFTPSVFSLDLPTQGDTEGEREAYKRASNLRLIHLMVGEIPEESKFCVSYGQLKGCYWTVPATSTQGTTKEGDKDYIVRVALSPNMDVRRHMSVFEDFVKEG